mgnify:CR=1 FL=1
MSACRLAGHSPKKEKKERKKEKNKKKRKEQKEKGLGLKLFELWLVRPTVRRR